MARRLASTALGRWMGELRHGRERYGHNRDGGKNRALRYCGDVTIGITYGAFPQEGGIDVNRPGLNEYLFEFFGPDGQLLWAEFDSPRVGRPRPQDFDAAAFDALDNVLGGYRDDIDGTNVNVERDARGDLVIRRTLPSHAARHR